MPTISICTPMIARVKPIDRLMTLIREKISRPETVKTATRTNASSTARSAGSRRVILGLMIAKKAINAVVR